MPIPTQRNNIRPAPNLDKMLKIHVVCYEGNESASITVGGQTRWYYHFNSSSSG